MTPKKKRRQKKHPLRLLLINQLLMKNQRMRNRFQLSTLKSKSQAIQLRKNPPRKNQNQLKRNPKLKLMKVKRNLKNKVMGQIIVKRTTKDKKNNNKKKIMKKTNMKNKYKQIQLLRKIINQHMVVSL